MDGYAPHAHAILLVDEGGSAILLRRVRGASVSYEAAGTPLGPEETPGAAARRAAIEHFGIEVEVGEPLYADTARGAEHYFFLARSIDGTAPAPRENAAAIPPAAPLAYRVDPRELARRLTRLGAVSSSRAAAAS